MSVYAYVIVIDAGAFEVPTILNCGNSYVNITLSYGVDSLTLFFRHLLKISSFFVPQKCTEKAQKMETHNLREIGGWELGCWLSY